MCYTINVICVDGVDASELMLVSVAYCDGLNDSREKHRRITASVASVLLLG